MHLKYITANFSLRKIKNIWSLYKSPTQIRFICVLSNNTSENSRLTARKMVVNTIAHQRNILEIQKPVETLI